MLPNRTTTTEPAWLIAARKDIGNAESLGPNDSPWIRRVLAALSGMWLKGQPWCGSALAYWMQQAGIPLPVRWYRAKGWLAWGYACRPTLGAVVVFERLGGGHVGLLVGYDDKRNALLVLGGNQGDSVRVSSFSTDRVLGYRWPAIGDAPTNALPFMASVLDFSRGEA